MCMPAVIFEEISVIEEPQEISLIEKKKQKKNSGFKSRIGFYLANCELIKWKLKSTFI